MRERERETDRQRGRGKEGGREGETYICIIYMNIYFFFQIAIIRVAKEKGLPITCEVCPHHLFLCEDNIPRIGKGRSEVRPILVTKEDQEALWNNLDIIDCFATDHGKKKKTTSSNSS